MRTPLWIGLLLVSLTACGGGGNGSSANENASKDAAKVSSTATGGSSAAFGDAPVQLTVNPCTLVTTAEAEQAIGHPVTQGLNKTICTYVANGNEGHIAVETLAPPFCKLLFLALNKNFFGGDQVRVDDVGDGGMLVKGNGNVQFVSHGGCVSIDAAVGDGNPPDDAMLSLGRAAASRVSG